MPIHFPLRLVGSRMLAPSVRHLDFARDDGQPLDFIPGQFIQVHFTYADGTATKRSYSLATIHDHALGSGDADYRAAFETEVEPAVRGFAPDILLVSAGFDAHEEDPLASMEVTTDGFRELAARCASLAPRVAAVLEGGYNLATLPSLVAAAHEGFSS